MMLMLLAAVALAVVLGFWYSYYQSVRTLRAHDRATVALLEREVERLEVSGAPPQTIDEARRSIAAFRTKHRVR